MSLLLCLEMRRKMRWNKFRLKIRTEAEDLVISALSDAGVEGVEIEDKVPLTEQEKQ